MGRDYKGELDRLVDILNKQYANGREFYVQSAYGQPRLHRVHGKGSEDISPRLSRPQLVMWIRAYLDGADLAAKQ